MATVYLYVKQHSITGLKYFGKTTKDPYTYMGSGKYWLRHIEKHGRDHVITTDVWSFEDQQECSEFANSFSYVNQIVESTIWANLAPENGTDGGYRPNNYLKLFNADPKTEAIKAKISNTLLGNKNACKPVMIDGVMYQSKVEAAKVYNVTPEALNYWVTKGKAAFV
jgi:hypothetical protein